MLGGGTLLMWRNCVVILELIYCLTLVNLPSRFSAEREGKSYKFGDTRKKIDPLIIPLTGGKKHESSSSLRFIWFMYQLLYLCSAAWHKN